MVCYFIVTMWPHCFNFMDSLMIFTVAIDGTAASGKGTIAKAIADYFGFFYLDTGLLYRAVAYKIGQISKGSIIIEEDVAIQVTKNLKIEQIDFRCLRTEEIANLASQISKIELVRAELLTYQRNFAQQEGGAVLDGRDIGTVVCPDAEVKIFITADNKTRARRRYKQLSMINPNISFDEVLENLIDRDENDASRAVAPMKKAVDALLLDTTELSIDAAVAIVISNVKEQIALCELEN